jgi:hypothetical protein
MSRPTVDPNPAHLLRAPKGPSFEMHRPTGGRPNPAYLRQGPTQYHSLQSLVYRHHHHSPDRSQVPLPQYSGRTPGFSTGSYRLKLRCCSTSSMRT